MEFKQCHGCYKGGSGSSRSIIYNTNRLEKFIVNLHEINYIKRCSIQNVEYYAAIKKNDGDLLCKEDWYSDGIKKQIKHYYTDSHPIFQVRRKL